MRVSRLLMVVGVALLGVAMGADSAAAQRSAKARVAVHVVPPAIPFTVVDSALSRAAIDSVHVTRHRLPAGARIVTRDTPRRGGSATPAGSTAVGRVRVVRTVTLEYSAN